MSLRPAPTGRWSDRRVLVTSVLLAAGIFIADLQLPVGISISALYGVIVLLGFFVRDPRFPLLAAAGATLLAIIGFALSPEGGDPRVGIVNRGLTMTGMWITAWLVTSYSSAGRALDRSMKDLADTNYALDQAAILAITDVKGRITYVNDKFCEISKYSRQELLGQDHRIINSGYHSKEFIRDLWRTIANGSIWHGELRNRAKDGTYYWVDTTIVPFIDDRGKPYQYMAIRYDITERKRTEALLREQAALARLGEMAAVVAHEVKNPLAGIRGALQVIGGRMPESSRDRAVVGDIVARLDSLNDIVHDLLVFARPREPNVSAVPIASLLEDTAALLRKDPAHASIEVTISGDRPTIRADPEQLQTVFLNLLLNAAQASGRAGEIRVAIANGDRECRVSIADRGPGVPEDVRERIFEPFFTTKHRGTGLGLPTARRVVERHMGSLEFECPPQGGTVVTVTLPTGPQQEARRSGD
ncbi:MAG TPA: ATP-binding protein [Vicinamibacterales bacterium]|nr:ATP-binding protein [Vicinamibacterales bacterium]